MRAWLLHKPAPIETNPLVLSEVPDPKPGPGEVLLRVHACAICRTDLHVVEGDLQQRVSPITPGHQVIGEVTAIGAGVNLSIGERRGVAWLQQTCHTCRFCRTGRENLCDTPALTGWTRPGGFAEYIVAPAETAYPIPVGFPDLQAAPLLVRRYHWVSRAVPHRPRLSVRLRGSASGSVRFWRSRACGDSTGARSRHGGLCHDPGYRAPPEAGGRARRTLGWASD